MSSQPEQPVQHTSLLMTLDLICQFVGNEQIKLPQQYCRIIELTAPDKAKQGLSY